MKFSGINFDENNSYKELIYFIIYHRYFKFLSLISFRELNIKYISLNVSFYALKFFHSSLNPFFIVNLLIILIINLILINTKVFILLK